MIEDNGDAPTYPRSPYTLAVGDTFQGMLNHGGDTDVMGVFLTAGKTYRIAMNDVDPDRDIDTYLEVTDEYLDRSFGIDQDSGRRHNSLLFFTPAESGTYFVHARSADFRQVGRYEVTVDEADTEDGAASLTVGKPFQGTLDYSGDTDVLEVELTAGTTYQIALDGVGDNGVRDPYLEIYDADGTRLEADDDSGPRQNSLLFFTPSATGTYSLHARSDSRQVGRYEVTVNEADVEDGVGPLAVGEAFQGGLDHSGDTDVLEVELTAGTTYQIAVDGVGDNGVEDTYLELYDSDGTRVEADDDSGPGQNSLVFSTPTETDTYSLRVGSDSRHDGDYEVTVNEADAEDVTDTEDGAGFLTVGEAFQGVLDHAGDTDVLEVELTAGTTYRIAMDGVGDNGVSDPYLEVYDGNGRQVGSDDDSGFGQNSLFTFTPAVTGTYSLHAGSIRRQAGDYEVTVNTVVDTEDDAAPLTVGEAFQGVLDHSGDTDVAGDTDVLKVDLTAGTTYKIAMYGVGDNGVEDPYLEIYDANGYRVGSDDDGGADQNSLLFFTPSATGRYFLHAGSAGHDGDYEVKVDVADTEDEAAPLTVGEPFQGTLGYAGDTDVLGVDLTAGTTYKIAMNDVGANGVGDPYLEIHDANGDQVEADDDSGPGRDSLIYFTPSATGRYFLHAGSAGQRHDGDYEVTVDVGDTEDNAAPLTVGESFQGTLDYAGDTDVLEVDLTAGTAYHVSLRSAGENWVADPYLEVYDENGRRVGFDDDSGINQNSLFTFAPAVTGTYSLHAGSDSGHTGGYEVAVDTVAGADPRVRLTVGEPFESTLTHIWDTDALRVNLTKDRIYTIAMDGVGKYGVEDPRLQVFTSYGVRVGTDDDSGPGQNALLTFIPTKSIEFVIRAGTDGGGVGDYRVMVTDVTDAVDKEGEVSHLTVGTPFLGRLGSWGETDVLEVDLTAGTDYRITMDTVGRNGVDNPYLEIHNANGDRVGANDNGGDGTNSLLRFTPSETGTYFVHAGSKPYFPFTNIPLGRTGDYQVKVEAGLDAHLLEEGKTFQDALSGFADGHDDFDVLKMELVEGTSYQIAMNGKGLRDPRLELYDANWRWVASDDNSGPGRNALISFTPSETGTYFLHAKTGSAIGGEYEITLNVLSADTEDAAPPLTVGDTFRGKLDHEGDLDVLEIDLTADKNYRLAMDGGVADPYLEIHDANGDRVGYNDDSGPGRNALISFTPSETGTYFLHAQSYQQSYAGDYEIAVNGVVNVNSEGGVIRGFTDGEDLIDLRAFRLANGFDDLSATQDGDHVRIDLATDQGGETITVADLDLADLDSGDFLF